MNTFGVKAESFSGIVTKNRLNGSLNPRAMLREPVTIDDVLSSEPRAAPLKTLDIAPTGDGACALVMARDEAIDTLRHKPVWILGAASVLGAHYLGDRCLYRDEALRTAAARAYEMARIKDPVRELDVIELSEHYSYQELLWSECLGLCAPAQGARLLLSGETQIGGRLPINPSGGLLSGSPFVVAGMGRVLECVLQIRGEAGATQVPHATKALAHGTTGPCGQGHCVLILGT